LPFPLKKSWKDENIKALPTSAHYLSLFFLNEHSLADDGYQ